MSLVLEIEYLSGVCFAALGPDSDLPDWPPQPDRVFSALVATWGARGERADEAEALEWLESQPVPKLEASEHSPRTAPISFVPPNDAESGRSGNRAVLPAFRRRQPRRFPATRPDLPLVRLIWSDVSPSEDTFAALEALAADTAYVGHSASLTRCRFQRGPAGSLSGQVRSPRRRVYPGRLAELRRSYELFAASGGKRGRPLAGAPVRPEPEAEHRPPYAFEDRWLLLEHVDGQMPDVRAAALVAKAIRDALLCGYRRAGLEDRIPEVVSGHAADGSPSRKPHLAIVPLPFTGFPYADGHIMGFALVPPRGSEILADDDLRRALRRIAPLDEHHGWRVVTVRPKAGKSPEPPFSVALSPTFEPPPGKSSLDPALYRGPARTFATITPIALDRHLKQTGEARNAEIADQLLGACRNVGLPQAEIVVSDKHSAFEGAPSAYPSGKSPPWLRWRMPATLRSRQLTHAVLRFPEPVQGPVLLGAGRYVGLGLCRPLSDPENQK